MNGMMGRGDLSTRKVIDLLRHGLERCIVCLVKQEKSNLPIDEVSLTNRGKINGVIRLLPQKEMVMEFSPCSVDQKPVLNSQTPKLPHTFIKLLSAYDYCPGAQRLPSAEMQT
mgnify:FL=1